MSVVGAVDRDDVYSPGPDCQLYLEVTIKVTCQSAKRVKMEEVAKKCFEPLLSGDTDVVLG
jgi:hypothetical protein